MRPIDWRSVLTEHRIPFVERGPNVKRGELNCRCPYCGSADPSHHMGLRLDNGYWCCWRNRDHRGKSPVRLLVALLGVPHWRAREIAGLSNDGDEHSDPDGYDAIAARIMRADNLQRTEQVRRRHLRFDREIVPFSGRRVERRFEDYLLHRGFKWIDQLTQMYDLHYALSGDFQDRVVLPYYLDNELVTWTGRAIGNASIRYRDLSIDDSLVPPKQTLFNHDCVLEGGEVLLVQEGPFDALKVDYFGRPEVRSVALSTNSITDQQIYMLMAAAAKFDRVVFVMDMATELGIVDSMRMRAKFPTLPNGSIAQVPFGAKDGGELTHAQVKVWCTQLRDGTR